MAVLIMTPTSAPYIGPESVERLISDATIEKAKATEVETLWRINRPQAAEPTEIVTNRYEESHQIMHDAHRRQQQKEQTR